MCYLIEFTLLPIRWDYGKVDCFLDVDTLEAPFGVAELVNVQTGNNLSNPVTSLSRRHSERDREFVSTGIVSSPMAERRAGVASRNSINQTISAANYHQSLPR